MELMTNEQLCEYLKVTRQTLYNWREEGMPSIKIGRGVRFELEKVMEWLKENEVK